MGTATKRTRSSDAWAHDSSPVRAGLRKRSTSGPMKSMSLVLDVFLFLDTVGLSRCTTIVYGSSTRTLRWV